MLQKSDPDPYGAIQQKKDDLLTEIKQTIDEMSNLRSLRQLEIETSRVKQANLELEQRAKVQNYRLEQASSRLKKIEEEEREKCKLTAEIMKKFEQNSCSGPFFDSLREILNNFQCNSLEAYSMQRWNIKLK